MVKGFFAGQTGRRAADTGGASSWHRGFTATVMEKIRSRIGRRVRIL